MEYECYAGKLEIRQSVKLLLLTPVSPKDGNEGPFPLFPPREYLLPSTHVDEMYCKGAPRVASEKVAPLVVAKTKYAESQGYDAVVVNCMLDPGVAEAKRAVKIPVVGTNEATRALASIVGKRPAHIFPNDISVDELAADEDKTFCELVERGQWMIKRYGADVIIPNCAYLSGLAQRLQAELGVPVLANLDIGLKLAELIATFGVLPHRENVLSEQRFFRIRVASGIRRLVSRGRSIGTWIFS
jgi:allantoin racemase